MKIKLGSAKNQGSVLLICMCFAFTIGIAAISYLYMVQGEFANTSRAQGWNNSMVIAEGGIEEGMSLINKYVATSTSLTNWYVTAVNDGWTQSNNVFNLTRTVAGGSYSLQVTNISAANVSIKSTGTFNWTNQSVTQISRAVLVNTLATSFFQRAMTSKTTIALKGGPIVDSFNSGSSNYSTGGLYDPTKREAHGDIMTVASNVVMTTDINLVGNARVYGHVITGPDDGVSLSGNAAIGDTNYAGTGIQSGWTNGTSNIAIADAPALPSGPWLPLPPAVGGTYTLTGLGPGTTVYYQVPSGTTSIGNMIITNGTVYLDVESNLRMTGQSQITIAPNASAVMWLNGSSADMEGQGVLNSGGVAANLIVYGTPNLTSLDMGGGSGFTGAVYAPYADITYHGGNEFIGSAIGNSFTDVGGADFHFDEALESVVSGSYIAITWSEVTP